MLLVMKIIGLLRQVLLPTNMITLVPYDSMWSKLFEAEKEKLQKILEINNTAVHIEHIGSTAIPGIYAKPIIDILIGVDDINHINIKNIELLGYQYNPTFESELPNRRYFQKGDASGNRTHQIHLVNYPSAWWERHLLFRNYLRKNADKAKQYEAHKLLLAQQFDDTMPYSIAKTAFCESINQQAWFDFDLHKPFVEIKSKNKKFTLNGYIPQQACFELYRSMCSDPDFIRCYGAEKSDEDIKKTLEKYAFCWDKYRYGSLIWFDKNTQDFVGKGGLNYINYVELGGNPEVELTYSLSKKYWGKNLAAEIGQYAIDYGFNILKLRNIICFTMTTNKQSLRVMEKLGFQYEKDFMYCNLLHKLHRLMS